MDRRTITTRLLAGLAIMALLAGCAGGVTVSPPSTTPSSQGPTASPTPNPTASPTPVASSGATVTSVSGTATCTWMHVYAPSSTTVGNSVAVTDPCTVTTNDPRVSGTETLDPWHGQQWGASVTKGAGVQWGRVRLENDGGAWEGTGSGVYSSDRGDIVASWFKGTGAYAGLGYFELRTGSGSPLTIRGLIFPGDPPDLTGLPPVTGPAPTPNVPASPTSAPAPTPTAIAYGPVSTVTGTSDYTVVDLDSNTFAGNVAANDPRVSGEFLAPSWTLDFTVLPGYDYGMGPQWGPSRITNAGGAWDGACSGVYDGSDAFTCWYRGTGGYAGLGYFELIARSDYLGPTGGEVTTGNFGQIFPGDPPTP